MAEMSMNKVIHAAFRRDLDRFVGALEGFQTGDLLRARQLGTAWDNFNAQLTHHHHGEHDAVWPALRSLGVEESLVSSLDGEHDVMAAALADADSAMKALARTASDADATAAAKALDQLRTVTVTHLDHEEQELEPFLREHHDDPEIKEMVKKLSKMGPAQGGTFFAWVTDGIGPAEEQSLKETIPAPVLKIVGGVWGRSYRRDIATVWQG